MLCIFLFTIIDYHSGFNRGHKRRHSSSGSVDTEKDDDEEEEETETINEQFRRGKNLDELGDDWGNNSENSIDPPDEMNDSEWNMLGAALEKEFLEN